MIPSAPPILSYFCGNAAHDERLYPAGPQDGLQIGGEEGPLAGLVDARLHRQGVELRDDVVPALAPGIRVAKHPVLSTPLLLGAVRITCIYVPIRLCMHAKSSDLVYIVLADKTERRLGYFFLM